ncbi:MAG: ATP-binding protein [Hyphomicrobiales bacterium]
MKTVSKFSDYKTICAGWIAMILLCSAVISIYDYQNFKTRLSDEGDAIARLASQRADQHDAHLTSLSAIATAGPVVRRDLFLDVAETIMRFYPRIVNVNLISLQDGKFIISTNEQSNPDLAKQMVDAAQTTTGSLQLRSNPVDPETYLLIKRSPNSNSAKYALALTIDGAALIETESDFWKSNSFRYRLSLPDGAFLSGHNESTAPTFSKDLGSLSQPLTLNFWSLPFGPKSISWSRIALVSFLATIVYISLIIGIRQYLRTRHAEKNALLSAQDARLAHASRVNALGEMASGLAHELTQPLTAILSQSQAGKHLATRGDAPALIPVLDDTITQAKRASIILERMRRWTKPSRGPVTQSSLSNAANVVKELLAPEASRQSTKLIFKFDKTLPYTIQAEPIELEQVIFNLVRNALDAVQDVANPTVEIEILMASDTVSLVVSDNGIGLPDDIKARLFEPFVTSKPEGTGLGLALCQRLVERMDGEISATENDGHTILTAIFPRADSHVQVAAQ